MKFVQSFITIQEMLKAEMNMKANVLYNTESKSQYSKCSGCLPFLMTLCESIALQTLTTHYQHGRIPGTVHVQTRHQTAGHSRFHCEMSFF